MSPIDLVVITYCLQRQIEYATLKMRAAVPVRQFGDFPGSAGERWLYTPQMAQTQSPNNFSFTLNQNYPTDDRYSMQTLLQVIGSVHTLSSPGRHSSHWLLRG
jgi:hypothetical protein